MIKLLQQTLVAAACAIGGAAFAAEAYPVKPIRLVNPFSPGGSTDFLVRTISTHLANNWGQSVVVENKPGAGTNIGTELVVRAAPDGYTVLCATSQIAINASLYPRLPFDAARDLAPVIRLVEAPNVLAVHPAVPAKSVRELLELARANPGKLNYGSSGSGATNHLAMELLKVMANVDVVHVPYKGGGQALSDLLAGRVQLMFNPPVSLMPHAAGGRVRPLAVSTRDRVDGIDLPTVGEAGVPGFLSAVWYGLFAPAGTSAEVIQKLNREVARILRSPEVAASLRANSFVIVAGTPEELGRHMREEIVRWEQVVKASGAKPD